MELSKMTPEPRGFSEHTRRGSSENAHQQGWGLNEEERRSVVAQKQESDGGTDYDYGARDFGDSPVNTEAAKLPARAAGETKRPARRRPGT
jgi:hypothetical protein